MARKPRIVIALGGNALGKTLPEQMIAAKTTSKAIADLVEEGYQVVISHGNGPQVGMINNAMAALSRENPNQPNTPLSVCVAMSQAYIGYDLQNALREELRNRKIMDPKVVTMVTQIEVDADDPAFDHPTKPIGHFMTEEQARHAEQAYGYVMMEDAGRGWRRAVASPMPKRIVEMNAIRALVEAEQIVIACGGGGIPVTMKGNHLTGASAVIDKDHCSALLAKELEAEFLIILTAVDQVAINYGRPDVRWLSRLTCQQAREYIAQGHFAPGSMLPKVEAAVSFAESGSGRTALITRLERAREGILGLTGTRICR
ncbi:MAG: carbamate kinase [Oscillospiraceae bacterium]|nr:carbamate kinase [Oscillospiraceae bacterium]